MIHRGRIEEDAKHPLFLHADGALGLVEHRLVLVGVLLAGSLVGEGLAGALLRVRNNVTVLRSVNKS